MQGAPDKSNSIIYYGEHLMHITLQLFAKKKYILHGRIYGYGNFRVYKGDKWRSGA